MQQLKITLKKSVIGVIPKHRLIVTALGLKKTGSSVIKKNDPAINGMIHKVGYLLQVEKI